MQINRRDAIKTMALGTAAVLAGAFTSRAESSAAGVLSSTYPYKLADLPYSHDALAGFIDAETMALHHGKHHAAYVNNLNKALESHPEWQAKTLQDLLADLEAIPGSIRATVRNNGGGHANHDLFWRILAPSAEMGPQGKLAEWIARDFGSLDECREALRKAAMSVFGSGWAWLAVSEGTLVVETSPNQDTPIMNGKTPVIGIDVWEHAYYLRYQNRRADYLGALLQNINWNVAGQAVA